MSNRTTISLIKADVGSLTGHHVVPPAFDLARDEALKYVSMLRRMRAFEPARLNPELMEYPNLPQIQAKLKDRFKSRLD